MSTPPADSSISNNASAGSPGKGARNGLVQSLLSGDREGIGGAICNDRNGLCLGAKGAMDASKSGVYTSLVKLASKLDPGSEPPLITIETDKAALLVKEYGGHAVALRVPVTDAASAAGTSTASSSADQATNSSS